MFVRASLKPASGSWPARCPEGIVLSLLRLKGCFWRGFARELLHRIPCRTRRDASPARFDNGAASDELLAPMAGDPILLRLSGQVSCGEVGGGSRGSFRSHALSAEARHFRHHRTPGTGHRGWRGGRVTCNRRGPRLCCAKSLPTLAGGQRDGEDRSPYWPFRGVDDDDSPDTAPSALIREKVQAQLQIEVFFLHLIWRRPVYYTGFYLDPLEGLAT